MPDRIDNSTAIVHPAYAGRHCIAGRYRGFEETGL